MVSSMMLQKPYKERIYIEGHESLMIHIRPFPRTSSQIPRTTPLRLQAQWPEAEMPTCVQQANPSASCRVHCEQKCEVSGSALVGSG